MCIDSASAGHVRCLWQRLAGSLERATPVDQPPPASHGAAVSKRQRGMTLIELIVFIVVVSVGLAGVMSVLNLTVMRSADPLLDKQALAAADAMMEEVLLKDFCDPDLVAPACTAPPEASRDLYDNVDDYGGYTSTGVYAPSDLATPLISGLNVAVQVATPGADLHGVPKDTIRRVTVTVTYGTDSVSLTGYRINYDAP